MTAALEGARPAGPLARVAPGRRAALGLPLHRRADATATARSLDELIILAPADDSDEAHHLARDSGARIGEVTSVDAVPLLLERLLGA